MVKIKTRKKMNLPEIIQWGWDNGIKNEEFMASLGGRIYFDEDSWIDIEKDNLISPEETFEVEVEEDITEETVIPKLIEFCDYDNDSTGLGYFYDTETRINDVKDHDSIAFYMLNDDLSMTLLWKDGEMVE